MIDFTGFLKDYTDYVNVMLDSGTLSIPDLVIYVFKSILVSFAYLISFQWLTNFTELPMVFKQNYCAIMEGRNVVSQSLQLDPNFYPVLNQNTLNSRNLVTGLLNSFFLALPFTTIPQLISLRAFVIHGVPAAFASVLGTALGQGLFFFLVLFGFDFFLQPLYQLHGLSIIFGIYLVGDYLCKMVLRPNFRVFSFRNWNNLRSLFVLNFLLAWFENQCIYHYLNNLTFNGSPNILQSSDNVQWWIFDTFGYWLGLTAGTVLWFAFFAWAMTTLYNWANAQFFPGLAYAKFQRRLHYLIIVGIGTLSMYSIPFYGIDYLATGPFNFIYQDSLTPSIVQSQVYVNESLNITNQQLQNPEEDTDNIIANVDPVSFYDIKHIYSDQPTMPEIAGHEGDFAWENREVMFIKENEKQDTNFFDWLLPDLNFKNDFSHNAKVVIPPTYKMFGVTDETSLEKIQKAQKKDQVEIKKNEIKDWSIETDTDKYARDKPEFENPNDIIINKNQITYLDTLGSMVFRTDIYGNYNFNETNQKELSTLCLFRQRFYSNPLYKIFMRMEMLPYVGTTQPHWANLSVDQEFELYKRRVVLTRYLDTVESYKRAATQRLQPWPKQVYNQQFSGSINLLKLFDWLRIDYPNDYPNDAATVMEQGYFQWAEGDKEEPTSKVLKFDQPLYTTIQDEFEDVLHEDLSGMAVKEKERLVSSEKKLKKRNLPTDALEIKKEGYAYMKPVSTAPIYIGWDGRLNKLLMKNGAVATSLPDEYSLPVNNQSFPNYFHFQAWSKGVEDPDKAKYYQIMDLCPTDQQVEKLRVILGFLEIDDCAVDFVKTQVADDKLSERDKLKIQLRSQATPLSQTLNELFGQPTREDIRRKKAREFVSNLPQYDWYWLKTYFETMPQDYEISKDSQLKGLELFLDIGNILPPELNGLAWPGVFNQRAESKINIPEGHPYLTKYSRKSPLFK